MPFPVAHALIGAGIFLSIQKVTCLREHQRAIAVCAFISVLPDADFAFSWFFHLSGWHRGFTHSFVFGVGSGFLGSLILGATALRVRLGILITSISHGVLDALVTTNYGTGIELLWPASNQRFKFGFVDYFSFKLDPRFDPLMDIFLHILKVSLIELVVLGPLFVALLLLKRDTSLITSR